MNHQVARGNRRAADRDHRRRDAAPVIALCPHERSGTNRRHDNIAGRRADQRRRREADRAVGPRALRPRRDGDRSVGAHVALHLREGIGCRVFEEGVSAASGVDVQRAQLLERAVERQLLCVVELGRRRWQVLVLDDRGVELPVVTDLCVVRLRAGLLAAFARDGVEVRIAERRRTELIEDPELKLLLVQRGAWHRSAAGHDRHQEHRRQRVFHLVPDRHDGRRPEFVTGSGTECSMAVYKTLLRKTELIIQIVVGGT